MLRVPKSPPVNVLSICERCIVEIADTVVESVSTTVSIRIGDSPIIKYKNVVSLGTRMFLDFNR